MATCRMIFDPKTKSFIVASPLTSPPNILKKSSLKPVTVSAVQIKPAKPVSPPNISTPNISATSRPPPNPVKPIPTPKRKTKNADEWPEEHLIELIEIYKQHPCLYDTKDPNYTNKPYRLQVLQNIRLHMALFRPNVTEESIKQKWNSLRTHFVSEVKKIEASKRSGTDTDSLYYPTMTYFDDLLFLRDHVKVRPTVSNAPIDEEPDDTEEDPDDPGYLDSTENQEPSTQSINIPKIKIPGPPVKKRKQSVVEQEELKILQTMGTTLSTIAQKNATQPQTVTQPTAPPANEDRFDHFGKFIASTLRTMPADEVNNIQLKITDAIFNRAF